MNRKKWQGFSCILLASLMMGNVYAVSPRNEAPKQNQAPKPIEMQNNKPAQQEQSHKPDESPKSSTAPKPAVIPAPPKTSTAPENTKDFKGSQPGNAAPKKETPKNEAVKPVKPVTPAMPEKPAGQVPSKPENTPDNNCKKPACNKNDHAQPGSAAPKCSKTCPKTSLTTQKPFTLDHFKMIICTLKQLGMEEQEIATYIKNGKKLEDILTAEKINPRKFKKCILKQYNQAIDQGIKEGQLTKEQGKQLKCAIKDTVKNWLPKK